MPNSKHKLTVALSEAQLQAVREAAEFARLDASVLTRLALAEFITRRKMLHADWTPITWPDDLPPPQSGIRKYNASRRKQS